MPLVAILTLLRIEDSLIRFIGKVGNVLLTRLPASHLRSLSTGHPILSWRFYTWSKAIVGKRGKCCRNAASGKRESPSSARTSISRPSSFKGRRASRPSKERDCQPSLKLWLHLEKIDNCMTIINKADSGVLRDNYLTGRLDLSTYLYSAPSTVSCLAQLGNFSLHERSFFLEHDQEYIYMQFKMLNP